jgi:aminoglycoside phosphotransferase family enzyme/predicted kinase
MESTPTTTAPTLVDRLLSPDAYPHPVERVELVETHISWVFLTGTYAYKVKKPVDLGFLDFTTLEKRRACCVEEVRLNSRFAPELYVDAVPIAGPAATARVGSAGPTIEWAVRLEQFEERDRLDHVLDRGGLSAGDCLTLAVDIAAVQERLATAAVATRWGTADTFRGIVHLNLDQLRQHRPDLAGRAAALTAWVDRQLALHAADLAERRAGGRIRECHGDLHLGNLVRHGGRIVAFDGIEFNESLRWIDVASDIAFLAMDLRARGRADLAATVVSGWVEAADDHHALTLMPVYLVYRAIVRAAVAAIRAAQTATGGAGATSHAECDRYMLLAERLAAPRRPLLVATCGISGSGKSTLAAAVAAATGGIRLRSDVERKRLAGMAAGDRPADAAATAAVYSAEMTRRTYERLADLSRTVLTAGWVAVVDAACLQRWQRGILADAAGRAGADLVWLDLDVPAAVAIGRVQSRAGGDDPSDATAQVVAGQLADRDPITAAEIAGTGPAHPGGTHPGITVVRVGADQPRDPAAVAAIVAQFPGAATREP